MVVGVLGDLEKKDEVQQAFARPFSTCRTLTGYDPQVFFGMIAIGPVSHCPPLLSFSAD
jgi:hypothetical protein